MDPNDKLTQAQKDVKEAENQIRAWRNKQEHLLRVRDASQGVLNIINFDDKLGDFAHAHRQVLERLVDAARNLTEWQTRLLKARQKLAETQAAAAEFRRKYGG